MSANIVPFDFNGNEIRTSGTAADPLFCLVDVCKVLEIDNPSQVLTRLDSDGVINNEVIDSVGRVQSATFINEPNLYRVIFQSRKPNAKAFQDWVFSEVLPLIRKTGGYQVQPSPLPALPALADYHNMQQSIAAFESTGDIQLAQLMKVVLANEALRATQNSPLLQPAEMPMQLEGAVDVAIRLGFRVPKNLEGNLGKFVKKVCAPLLQGKNNRYSHASSKQISANMYPANHPEVESAVRAFFS